MGGPGGISPRSQGARHLHRRGQCLAERTCGNASWCGRARFPRKQKEGTDMASRYPFLCCSVGFVVLTFLQFGCDSASPVVAETPPPPVSVSQPLVREVIDYDDYEGRIAAVKVVDVRARVRGHLLKINFEDGQMV